VKASLDTLLIDETATVRDAIAAIDRGAVQLAIVVDAARRLVATVTDGDVRRGLLRGVGLDAPVGAVMRTDPVTARAADPRWLSFKTMTERRLHQLPVIDADGRVIGLELLEDLAGRRFNDNWVVLMAGGLGTRLRPLTESMPKPMLEIGGRPLLETIVGNLAAQGFRRLFISVNYKREVIQRHFGDGARFDVAIDYLVEEERLGTAGALSLLPGRPDLPVIVMNGDLLTSVDLTDLLRFHEAENADATLCVREHVTEIPFGVVEIDGTRLTGIVEKPRRICFVSAGIYVLAPTVLDRVLPGGACDMPQILQSLVDSGSRVSVFPLREHWRDIGQSDDLDAARAEYVDVTTGR
jgi:dTDP-glucose pyrophosphorylase